MQLLDDGSIVIDPNGQGSLTDETLTLNLRATSDRSTVDAKKIMDYAFNLTLIAPEIEPAIEPEIEPETEPETGPETEPETEPEIGPEAEPETEPETEPEIKPEIDIDSQEETSLNITVTN